MSSLNRLTSNYVYTLGGHFIESCTNVLLLAVVARYLQPERFGILAFSMAFVQMFYFLADVGLVRLLVREIARHREEAARYLGAGLITRLFMIIAIVPVLIAIINLVSSSPETITAVYILILWIVLRLLSTIYSGLFQALERMEFDSGLTVLSIIVRLGLTVLAVCFDKGIAGVLYAMVLAQLLYLLAAIVIANRKFTIPIFTVEPKLWKFLILQSIPIGASGFFNTAYHQVDTLVLTAFRDSTQVGLYNGPYRIIHQLLVLPLIFMRAPFPIISRLYRTSTAAFGEVCEQLFKFSLALGLPIGASLAIFGDKVILLILGPEFLKGTFVLTFYSGIVVMMFPAMFAATMLFAIDRQNLAAIVMATCVLLNTILDFFLIPPLGGVGACIATLIASFVMSVALILCLFKYLRPISLWRVSFQPVLATAGMALFLYIFRAQGLVMNLICGGILYLALILFLIWIFSIEEIRNLREIIRQS